MGNAKQMWCAATGLAGIFVPVQGLVACALIFVAVDFATGVAASRCRARRAGVEWRFSSRRAWDTVLKTVFSMAGILLAWMLDNVVVTFATLHLANVFTGVVCGVEFWSYLENAADISGHSVFRTVKRILRRRVKL